MFDGPIRGGTRGGQGEFKWSDVSADKDRENYLGHSINAPTGRWQKNKDVHWYNRDIKAGEAERLEEIRKIKEVEEDALAVALGFKPAIRPAPGTEPGSSKIEDDEEQPMALEDPAALAAKEEKRRRKEERRRLKEEKRERKELKRLLKIEHGDAKGDVKRIKREEDSGEEHDSRRYRTGSPSRSRSPRRPIVKDEGRSLSRSPSYDGGGYRFRGRREEDGRQTREDRMRWGDRDYRRERGVYRR